MHPFITLPVAHLQADRISSPRTPITRLEIAVESACTTIKVFSFGYS